MKSYTCWHVNKKTGSYYKIDKAKSSEMSSLEFVKTLYGEYFPERIPEYDNEEERKQLEQMREAIDKRIKELQQEQKLQEEIWKEQQ